MPSGKTGAARARKVSGVSGWKLAAFLSRPVARDCRHPLSSRALHYKTAAASRRMRREAARNEVLVSLGSARTMPSKGIASRVAPHRKSGGRPGELQGRTAVSRYFEVYASWKRDPQAFWAEAAGESTGTSRRTRSSTPTRGSMAAGSREAVCNTCSTASTATSSGRRPHQAAIIYDSPSPAKNAASPTPSCSTSVRLRRRAARHGRRARATGSSSICR